MNAQENVTAAFTTPTGPTVTTGTVGSITTSTAVVTGNSYICTGTCSGTVTVEGVCYAVISPPTNVCTIHHQSTTPWNDLLTGMLPGTVYYYQAYATSATGTGVGNVQGPFTTLIAPNFYLGIGTLTGGFVQN
jgi:hypothetical protein